MALGFLDGGGIYEGGRQKWRGSRGDDVCSGRNISVSTQRRVQSRSVPGVWDEMEKRQREKSGLGGKNRHSQRLSGQWFGKDGVRSRLLRDWVSGDR